MKIKVKQVEPKHFVEAPVISIPQVCLTHWSNYIRRMHKYISNDVYNALPFKMAIGPTHSPTIVICNTFNLPYDHQFGIFAVASFTIFTRVTTLSGTPGGGNVRFFGGATLS